MLGYSRPTSQGARLLGSLAAHVLAPQQRFPVWRCHPHIASPPRSLPEEGEGEAAKVGAAAGAAHQQVGRLAQHGAVGQGGGGAWKQRSAEYYN